MTYNLAHSWAPGFAALAFGIWLAWPTMLALAAILIAHVGMDRAAGYGLKLSSSFQDTHLGSDRTREGMSPARARTSSEEIIAAGRALLESGGLEAVTMQAVAQRVGVRAPSLYKRVPGRAALIAAIGAERPRRPGSIHRAVRARTRMLRRAFGPWRSPIDRSRMPILVRTSSCS